MKFIITIDTEEDNWGRFADSKLTTENIERIPYLQDIFDELSVIPTYLVTYPVATDKTSIKILRKILHGGRCELGTHCHPWNTPPFEEEENAKNSMLCNLPAKLQLTKLKNLHTVIKDNFGITPIIFRAGRWAFNEVVLGNLYHLGYRIDTSVTPFVDWSQSHGPDYTKFGCEPFFCSPGDSINKDPNAQILELPTTIGFIPRSKIFTRFVNKLISRYNNQTEWKRFLTRIKLTEIIWLSPEESDSTRVTDLIENSITNGLKIFNMVFHSTSLLHGLTPFVKHKHEEEMFLGKIRKILLFMKDNGILSINPSDIIEDYLEAPALTL
ncbi:MAG: hypothetical protein ACFFCW_07330 [Candidatus Hodarchaeota archaeon]